eukprot:TRINITY_DN7959_c0_g2_i2.p1 TRINITY_DN7959_c0_g2~~TRINITY_DN7959_c0_g2_i2.p1  ORF type:complete len:220 (+),score=89.93 TRINITY_DN7959_c0_g2_i2:104-763(+)
MKDAEGDPWLDVEDKYQAGQKVEGVVEKQEQFGIFIQLEPGITGLLPKSVLARSEKAAAYEKLHPGDPVEVVIGQVKPGERKISLTTGDAQDDGEFLPVAPKRQPSTGTTAGMGLLGAKLQEALDKKKQQSTHKGPVSTPLTGPFLLENYSESRVDLCGKTGELHPVMAQQQRLPILSVPVQGVANDGMAQPGQMRPNLVPRTLQNQTADLGRVPTMVV